MFDRPERAMLVIPHPDDAEGGVGGTVAKWVAEGTEVVFVLCTNGDKGTSDPEMTTEKLGAIREKEQAAAAECLGVKEVIYLRYGDGELDDTAKFRGELVRAIRKHTVAKWVAEGTEVVFVLCTNGDKGTSDPEMTTEKLGAIREKEQAAAAECLGVKEVIYLRYGDGELDDTAKFRGELVRAIRKHRPDVVFCTDPFRQTFYLTETTGYPGRSRSTPSSPTLATSCTTTSIFRKAWRHTRLATFSCGAPSTPTPS